MSKADGSGDAQASGRAPATEGSVAGVVVGLLAGSFGMLFVVVFFLAPIYRSVASLGWTATPCTILTSEVEALAGEEGGVTYAVEMTYTYQAPDPARGGQRHAFTGARCGFGRGGTAGRGSKQQVVDENPPGTRRTCWVDPANPASAVVTRAVGIDVLWFSFLLLFPAVGSGMAWLAWPRRPRSLALSTHRLVNWAPLALAVCVLGLDLLLLSVYVELLTPPFERGAPDLGAVVGLAPFLLLGLYVLWRVFPRALRAYRDRQAGPGPGWDGPGAPPPSGGRRPSLGSPPAEAFYARVDASGVATELCRVVNGRADVWKHHGWEEIRDRDPRVLREHYRGQDLYDQVPRDDVWKHQIAVGKRARTRTIAYWFKPPAPLSLAEIAARLEGIGGPWSEVRLPSGRTALTGALSSAAKVRLCKSGPWAVEASLTIHAATESEVEPLLAEARAQLLGELLPHLEPQELRSTAPFPEKS
jgi:hypothetical protein